MKHFCIAGPLDGREVETPMPKIEAPVAGAIRHFGVATYRRELLYFPDSEPLAFMVLEGMTLRDAILGLMAEYQPGGE